MRPAMLTGYRVLDITQFVAGPTCGRILVELGAEVIKIELAPFGDRSRTQGVKPRDPAYKESSQSSYYLQHNHSKRSLALDFKHARGRELIRRLVAKSDVLVENFAPGAMARAGLSYDELKEINPGLVMCSISLAGQSGPLSDKPGYDYVAQAYAGVTDLIGEPEQSLAMVAMAIGDVSTGVAGAMAIAVALLHRERTGEGQHIERTRPTCRALRCAAAATSRNGPARSTPTAARPESSAIAMVSTSRSLPCRTSGRSSSRRSDGPTSPTIRASRLRATAESTTRRCRRSSRTGCGSFRAAKPPLPRSRRSACRVRRFSRSMK